MSNRMQSTTQKPAPFDPDKDYPAFDKDATEIINGKNITLIGTLLDTSYLNPVPENLVNLSVVSPYDHRIQDAVTHNIALQLLESLRPRWPLRIIEWVLMPDQMLKTRKEHRLTERYLGDSLSASPERKAALFRVVSSLSPKRINLMSLDAQNIVNTALFQMTSSSSPLGE